MNFNSEREIDGHIYILKAEAELNELDISAISNKLCLEHRALWRLTADRKDACVLCESQSVPDYRCGVCGEFMVKGASDETTIHFEPCKHDELSAVASPPQFDNRPLTEAEIARGREIAASLPKLVPPTPEEAALIHDLHERAEAALDIHYNDPDGAWAIRYTMPDKSTMRFTNRARAEMVMAQVRGIMAHFAAEVLAGRRTEGK